MHPTCKQIGLPTTAVAGEKSAQDGDMGAAVIAVEITAKLYGLEILEMPVNDCRFNSTRFIIVTNRKMYEKDARKVSICFELPHVSVSLYKILSHIIYNALNMCKI